MLSTDNLNQFEEMKRLLHSIKNPNLRYNNSGWAIKQIVGHMIDSCSMNHQRIGRRKPNAEASLPGYEQESFVLNMNYADMEFADLLDLWEAYNTVLLKTFSSLSDSDLDSSSFLLQDGTAKPYRWWIDSYFDHMLKHTNQILRILEGKSTL